VRNLVIVVFLSIATIALISAPDSHAAFGDITLVGSTTLTGQSSICDVWGWVDPNTNKEYAIVGNWSGPARLYIVDVSNPANPTEVAFIDGASGFDPKVFEHYIYTCDGNSLGNDSRVIDISTPSSPVLLPGSFRSAHNIAISESGYMFLDVSGLSLWDLNTTPTAPDSLWHAGNLNGHDSTPVDNDRVWDFAGWDGFAKLWDYSNPSLPVLLSTITNPSINYWHSGDQSDDGNYVYICDELATGPLQQDIYVYDISNLASPTYVTGITDTDAIVHNLYIIGGLAFVSHYNSGFKTIDVRNPASPVVLDSYDTNVQSGETFDGAFGVYPFGPNGLVFISDWDNGLFVFQVEGFNGSPTAIQETPGQVAGAVLHQNFPNPFNPSTTISYDLSVADMVTLSVYDVRGGLVRTLESRQRDAGSYQAAWDGTNDSGRLVASGMYYYRLDVGATTTTRKMTLLK